MSADTNIEGDSCRECDRLAEHLAAEQSRFTARCSELKAENRTLRNVGVVLQERVDMALDFLDRYVTSGEVTRAQANHLRALLRQSSELKR